MPGDLARRLIEAVQLLSTPRDQLVARLDAERGLRPLSWDEPDPIEMACNEELEAQGEPTWRCVRPPISNGLCPDVWWCDEGVFANADGVRFIVTEVERAADLSWLLKAVRQRLRLDERVAAFVASRPAATVTIDDLVAQGLHEATIRRLVSRMMLGRADGMFRLEALLKPEATDVASE